jgi:hypothetical protein
MALNIIIGRHDAANSGLHRFNTGRPCKRGHMADRFVSNGACVECVKPPVRVVGANEAIWSPSIVLRAPLRPEHVEELKKLLDQWAQFQMQKWGYFK